MDLQLVGQFDGSNLAGLNCNCAVGAMLVAWVTQGAHRPSAADVRRLVREPSGIANVIGGTNPAQVAAALDRGWNVSLDVRYRVPLADVVSRAQQAPVGLSIGYSPVAGTVHDACPGFRGNHEIALFRGLVFDPLADGRRHGIPDGPERWGDDLLRRACGALEIGNGKTLGEGFAYAMFAPPSADAPMVAAGDPTPHEAPHVTFRFGGEPRYRGSYRVCDGIRAARIRTAPLIPDGTVVRTVVAGSALPFRVAQTTQSGTAVGGIRRWMGDATGTRWVHGALIEALS
jgi:hypothetical protein